MASRSVRAALVGKGCPQKMVNVGQVEAVVELAKLGQSHSKHDSEQEQLEEEASLRSGSVAAVGQKYPEDAISHVGCPTETEQGAERVGRGQQSRQMVNSAFGSHRPGTAIAAAAAPAAPTAKSRSPPAQEQPPQRGKPRDRARQAPSVLRAAANSHATGCSL